MLNLSFRLILYCVLSLSAISNAESANVPDRRIEAKQDALMYKVGRGEHIAEILRSMGYRNLWGTKGSVARTIQLNKENLASDNSLTPGQWIYIPKKGFRGSADFAVNDGVVQRLDGTNARANAGPSVSQVFKVTCPDSSVIDAQVTIVPSSSPGGISRMVFAKDSPVCASTVSQSPPVPAEQKATREPAQDTASKEAQSKKDEKAEGPLEEKQSKLIDELRHTDKDRPMKSVLKTRWRPIVEPVIGYKDQKFTSSSGGFASYLGLIYGLNGGVEWGRSSWGIGGLLNYTTGSLTNKGVSSDKVTLTDLGADLRLRFRSLFLQIGYAQVALKNTFSGDTLSKSATGLSYGIGYQGLLSEHWSFIGMLKHNEASFGNDSKILNKLESSGWAATLGVQYRWGSDL